MKMETPKMDVVRFQEADVIVASGVATYVTLSNLGNNDFNDNTASGHSAGSNFSLGFSDMKGGTLAQLLNLESNFNNGTSTSSLKNLVDNTYDNDDDDAYAAFNGNYVWTNGEYLRQ